MADPLQKREYPDREFRKEQRPVTPEESRQGAYDAVYCYVKLGDVRVGKIHIDRIKLRRRHGRVGNLEGQAAPREDADAPETPPSKPQRMHLIADSPESTESTGDADAELHGVTLEDVEIGTIFLQKPKDGDTHNNGGG